MAIHADDRSPRLPAGLAPLALGAFTVMHGIAHFAGTAGSLQHVEDGTAEQYLGGHWDITDPALLRSLAVLWALLGLATISAGVLIALRYRRAPVVLAAVAVASLVLSTVALWAAVVGVLVNLALLGLALWAPARLFGPERSFSTAG
jgi:hypothetical protein